MKSEKGYWAVQHPSDMGDMQYVTVYAESSLILDELLIEMCAEEAWGPFKTIKSANEFLDKLLMKKKKIPGRKEA